MKRTQNMKLSEFYCTYGHTHTHTHIPLSENNSFPSALQCGLSFYFRFLVTAPWMRKSISYSQQAPSCGYVDWNANAICVIQFDVHSLFPNKFPFFSWMAPIPAVRINYPYFWRSRNSSRNVNKLPLIFLLLLWYLKSIPLDQTRRWRTLHFTHC